VSANFVVYEVPVDRLWMSPGCFPIILLSKRGVCNYESQFCTFSKKQHTSSIHFTRSILKDSLLPSFAVCTNSSIGITQYENLTCTSKLHDCFIKSSGNCSL